MPPTIPVSAWTATGAMGTGHRARTATLLTKGQALLAGRVGFALPEATVLANANLLVKGWCCEGIPGPRPSSN